MYLLPCFYQCLVICIALTPSESWSNAPERRTRLTARHRSDKTSVAWWGLMLRFKQVKRAQQRLLWLKQKFWQTEKLTPYKSIPLCAYSIVLGSNWISLEHFWPQLPGQNVLPYSKFLSSLENMKKSSRCPNSPDLSPVEHHPLWQGESNKKGPLLTAPQLQAPAY